MKLLVGLGNPGTRYTTTRHNVGFLMIDRWAHQHAQRIETPWGDARRPTGYLGRFMWTSPAGAAEVIMIKPSTMMNASGEAVRRALDEWQVSLCDCAILCDDLNLPLGQLRFRPRGSAGGHHGLVSIIHAVGSTEFPRLRMGIGVVPPRIDATAYVLTSFDRTEQPIVDRALGAAADAIELWLCKGSEHVMNQFNRRTTSEGV